LSYFEKPYGILFGTVEPYDLQTEDNNYQVFGGNDSLPHVSKGALKEFVRSEQGYI